ncbi:MAG: Gfo/Idh/MocA family oxidoreductase [Acholeplasmataceae bacterium]|nr:Gfo/Idh/MocA family oxidoreductase [Acholeplasmataceae bacterium]
MKKLKVGIVGCGGIGTQKHMPSLALIEEVEMVGFCDIIVEKAEKAKNAFGTKDAKVYKDYKDMLKDTSIDVIHVCTPNRSHSFITVDALEAGKHVMCEKPMAISSIEAQKMVDAAKHTGRKLTVGYQNRYRGDSMYLKAESEKGTLGEIYYAKAHAIRRRAVPTWGVFLNAYEQGGGPLIDIGTHALDLTLWTMNNYKPKMVVGSIFHKLGKQRNTANAWGDWKIDELTVEDSAFGYVVMENGATIVLESSWALNSLDVREAQTTLCGTLAGADMQDGLRINFVKNNRQVVEKPSFEAGGVAFFAGGSSKPDHIEARMWIDAILHDKEPLVKPEEAFVVTQILEAIYESAKTGKPVFLGKKES